MVLPNRKSGFQVADGGQRDGLRRLRRRQHVRVRIIGRSHYSSAAAARTASCREDTLVRERRNLKIRGTVQGVFFRETVRHLAALYDVKGFVRNVSFDALEVEAEGEPEIVNAFIEKILAHPPRGARIDDVRSALVASQGDEGFSVLPSIR